MKKLTLAILSVAASCLTAISAVGYFKPISMQSAQPPWELPGTVSAYGHPPFYEIRIGKGYICVNKVYPAANDMPRCYSWTNWDAPLIQSQSSVSCLGLFVTGTISIRCHATLPIMVCVFFPAFFLFRRSYRSHWRRKMGRCLGCGYDLTCNVSGACPECGITHRHEQVRQAAPYVAL